MSHDRPPDGGRRPRWPAPGPAFTPAEHAALALLRRAIETGAYDGDVPPPRHEQQGDAESLVACLNGAGIVAAIVAAALASAAG